MLRLQETGIDIQFMVPGFSKCGTSTLCALLGDHPSIGLPVNKESNFFIDDNYRQHWSAYRGLFPPDHRDLICGDGTTMYSTLKYEKMSRDKILHYFPDIKLIFLVRDPLKRIESSFGEFHHSGADFGIDTAFDIEAALTQLPQLIDDSLYFSRLSCYLEKIPEQRILIIFLEDLVADSERELRRCFNFLEVDPNPAATIPLRLLNGRQEKLCDSKMLRRLRAHPYWQRYFTNMNPLLRNKIFKALGLRKSVAERTRWSRQARATIAGALIDDMQSFLSWAGRDSAIWPDFAELVTEFGVLQPGGSYANDCLKPILTYGSSQSKRV